MSSDNPYELDAGSADNVFVSLFPNSGKDSGLWLRRDQIAEVRLLPPKVEEKVNVEITMIGGKIHKAQFEGPSAMTDATLLIEACIGQDLADALMSDDD